MLEIHCVLWCCAVILCTELNPLGVMKRYVSDNVELDESILLHCDPEDMHAMFHLYLSCIIILYFFDIKYSILINSL